MSAPTTIRPPKPRDVVSGKYRIEGVLGEGGMGIVFAATHAVTDKPVALKWLRPAASAESVKRVVREAHAAARIQHPNVVDVYDVDQHDGCVYLVMERLYGEPLSAMITRGPLEPQATIHLLMPALRGVAAAHRSGVVHRDIKPENIFLCQGADGSPREAKLLDLGISKLLPPGRPLVQSLTRPGSLLGTPTYMSPEQILDPKRVDPRTDVYSFGVILYEALTGRPPFCAERLPHLLVEIQAGRAPRPLELRADLPEALDAVIRKAMAREPVDRYPDIATLARALEPFAPGAAFVTDPTGGYSLRRDSAARATREEERLDDAAAAAARPAVRSVQSVSIPMRRSGTVWLALVAGVFVAMLLWAWL